MGRLAPLAWHPLDGGRMGGMDCSTITSLEQLVSQAWEQGHSRRPYSAHSLPAPQPCSRIRQQGLSIPCTVTRLSLGGEQQEEMEGPPTRVWFVLAGSLYKNESRASLE